MDSGLHFWTYRFPLAPGAAKNGAGGIVLGVAERRGAITRVWFSQDTGGDTPPAGCCSEPSSGRPPVGGAIRSGTPLLAEAARQLGRYFAGRLRVFDLPLEPEGTPFQRAVWEALRAIPYGARASYSGIAAAIGKPRAARAVGMANNRNPIAIIIPCHRVVGKDGSPVGYAGGLDIQQRLLDLESEDTTT